MKFSMWACNQLWLEPLLIQRQKKLKQLFRFGSMCAPQSRVQSAMTPSLNLLPGLVSTDT